MTEEDDMVPIVERYTTDESTDEDNQIVILLLGLCCILFVTSLIIIIFRTNGDPIDKDESTEYYIPAAATPVQPTPGNTTTTSLLSSRIITSGTTTSTIATSSGVQSTTSATTTPAITTTTEPPLPHAPLICIITSEWIYWKNDRSWPADGTCDFITLRMAAGPRGLLSAVNSHMESRFYAAAKVSVRTRYALELSTLYIDIMAKYLPSRNVQRRLMRLWDMRVRHYGILQFQLTSDKNAAFSAAQTVRKSQAYFKSNYTIPPSSYFLLGVYYDSDFEAQWKDVLDYLIGSIKPDVFIYVTTTYLPTTALGYYTGPNMWNNAPEPSQATIKRALEYRKRVSLPKGTAEALTLNVCALEQFSWTGNVTNSTVIGNDSAGNQIAPREEVCQLGPHAKIWKDDIYESLYALRESDNKFYVFDDRDTYQKKMCWAVVNESYYGGWAPFAIECSDVNNACNDTKYGGDFAVINWVKEYAAINFTTC